MAVFSQEKRHSQKITTSHHQGICSKKHARKSDGTETPHRRHPAKHFPPRLLRAGLVMVCASTRRLGVGFAHVLPFLRLAIKLSPRAVIHLRRSVHPHHSRPPARSGGSRRLRRRRCGSVRLGSGSRSRCCRRLSRRSRSSGSCSLRTRSRSSRPPVLHALVSTARSLLARSRRIRTILALPGRTRRSASRCLCHQRVRSHQPRSHHHQSNRRLHIASKNQLANLLKYPRERPILHRCSKICHQSGSRPIPLEHPYCSRVSISR
jgi:hypothetical protein